MLKSENIEVSLAAHALLNKWFQTLLGWEPMAQNMEWLTSETSLETLKVFVDDSDVEALRDLGLIERSFTEYAQQSEAFLDRMKDQYTRIFVGPGKLPLFHWESVILKKDAVLFQESTLKVRKAYVEQGFLPRGYPNVADDHIAIELDFLANLGSRMVECYNAEDEEGLKAALAASARFMDSHLLVWVGAYSRSAESIRGTYTLYPEAISLLAAVAKADRDLLGELEGILAN